MLGGVVHDCNGWYQGETSNLHYFVLYLNSQRCLYTVGNSELSFILLKGAYSHVYNLLNEVWHLSLVCLFRVSLALNLVPGFMVIMCRVILGCTALKAVSRLFGSCPCKS